MEKMFSFMLLGQMKSGKNHVQITRSGHRYPLQAWALWRDGFIRQINDQWAKNALREPLRLCVPCRVTVKYWSGDLRRRDVPGMIDALWSCLEKGRFVEDDSLLETVFWTHEGCDRKNPRAHVSIEPITAEERLGIGLD